MAVRSFPVTERRYRIGFDIGGTFTDFALHDAETGRTRIFKSLTTPSDPSKGAIAGLEALLAEAGLGFPAIHEIVHGTTLVTNALIEGKGAPTGLLTTCGFRDVIELGREQRYDVYDLFLKHPTPLVPRRFRREVKERILSTGQVLTALDLDEVRRSVRALRSAGVTAIAVCFLHSYRNPEHELAVGRLLSTEFPELAVSLSCEVVAEVREYERACTTVANAFVQPLMNRYLETLERRLAAGGFKGRLSLMLSSGGLVTPDVARRLPIRLLESGPAGGALSTTLLARQLGCPELISFDMGGTTAKTALIGDYKAHVASMMEVARVHRFKKGSGIPVRAPVVEMIEIGAGGGSIAHLDEVGLLKVGPRSAAADPGPACYGLGGQEATVTDANLALGYLDPGFFLGGRMRLDVEAARTVLEKLGKPLGLNAAATAWGVYNIVCENMAASARSHIVEKGRDPRSFSMAAFGGAGPAHAALIARIIGVEEVLIPPASGAASAIGFLAAPASFETVRSAVLAIQEDIDLSAVNQLLAELEHEARAQLREAVSEEHPESVARFAEMRLRGQIHEIQVPLPPGPLTASSLGQLRSDFARVYEALYRAVPTESVIEALSWRVRVSGPHPKIELRLPDATQPRDSAVKGTRPVYFGTEFVEAQVYDRYSLRAGDHIVGPAIIEERESTTIVPPGDAVTVDQGQNLRLRIGSGNRRLTGAPAQLSTTDLIARLEGDPIGLEVMWSRLVNITEDCWDIVLRTAFSLIMSDAQDFSVALFDREGDILAHSPRAQPVFNLCLPRVIEAVLERFPAAELRPGDVLVTNDPWLASGHLYDVAIITPVFHEGGLVGHIGTIGHVTDIGGTKDSSAARELFEEGLQIPPMKLYREGAANEDLLALIKENVREPQQVIGDIHALVAAAAVGGQRLREFLSEYGLHDLTALAQIFQSRSEVAMRDAIRAMPDGVYESSIAVRIGKELRRLPVKIEIRADEIEIDLSGAPPESSQGGINCPLNYASSHCVYPFKCLLTPTVRGNSGCYRAFTVKIPSGTLLNCRKPASVRTRQVTGWFIGPNVFSALAEALPGRVRAYTGLPCTAPFYGSDENGVPFIGHMFAGGGQGGSATDDGKSGLLYPIGSSNTSTELFELRTQLLVSEKQLCRDSAGAGRHRGGLGQVMRIVKLLGRDLPVQLLASPIGLDLDLPNMLGGTAGTAVEISVNQAVGGKKHEVTAMQLVTLIEPGDAVEFRTAGGYGYGDPLERSVTLVQSDIENEYISREHAEAQYGCVFDHDDHIDVRSTEARRKRLHSAKRIE